MWEITVFRIKETANASFNNEEPKFKKNILKKYNNENPERRTELFKVSFNHLCLQKPSM